MYGKWKIWNNMAEITPYLVVLQDIRWFSLPIKTLRLALKLKQCGIAVLVYRQLK